MKNKKLKTIVCEICGKKFEKWQNDILKTKHHFCSRKCFYKSPSRSPNLGRTGEKSVGWKGGCIYERGYKLVRSPEHPFGIPKGNGVKYVREHRLAMENLLGRYLLKDEVVHHIDGNINNNAISNLCLYTNSEHSRMHRLKENGRVHPSKQIEKESEIENAECK